MKIAYIYQPFEYIMPPHVGGSVALWTERMMRAYPQGEASFIVYAPKHPGQAAVEWHDGIQYRRVTARPDNAVAKVTRFIDGSFAFPHPEKAYFTSAFHYLGYIAQIARDLQAQKVDIVHIHNFSQFVPIVRAMNPKAKIILHMHCEWLSQLDREMIRKRIEKADMIIGCSEHIAGKIRARFPELASRVERIYNGADENLFRSAEQPSEPPSTSSKQVKRILFVGRISPEKGVHVLLEAFQQVLAQYPDVELDLVGPWGEMPAEYLVLLGQETYVSDLKRFYPRGKNINGGYAEYLKGLIQPQFASKIKFHGSVRHDQTRQFYQNADIFINASLSDAFPVPIPEAMINHLPIVASRVGGIPEAVVDGTNGLLAEPGSANALANAVLCLLRDEDLRKQMGQASFARFQSHFSYPVIAAHLLDHYRRL